MAISETKDIYVIKVNTQFYELKPGCDSVRLRLWCTADRSAWMWKS